MRAMPSRAASRSPNGEALNGSLPMDRAWYYLTFEERAAMVGALGGVTFGYDIGVIAGALVSLSEDFSLDANTEGLVVAMIAFGQMPGAVVGGLVTDKCGRKAAILAQNGLYFAGSVVTAGATSVGGLLWGQFVIGIGVAFSVASNISYVTEMVGRDRAGAMVALYELATTFGVLLAFLVFLAIGTEPHAWRTMYLAGLAFPLLQAVAVAGLPESPTWLFTRGHLKEARRALLRIHEESDRPVPLRPQPVRVVSPFRMKADVAAAAGGVDDDDAGGGGGGGAGSAATDDDGDKGLSEVALGDAEGDEAARHARGHTCGNAWRGPSASGVGAAASGGFGAAAGGGFGAADVGGSAARLRSGCPRTEAALLGLEREAAALRAEDKALRRAMAGRLVRARRARGTATAGADLGAGAGGGGGGSGGGGRRTRWDRGKAAAGHVELRQESTERNSCGGSCGNGASSGDDGGGGGGSGDDGGGNGGPKATRAVPRAKVRPDVLAAARRARRRRPLQLLGGRAVVTGWPAEVLRTCGVDWRRFRRAAHHWRGPVFVMVALIFFTFTTGGINVRIYAPTIFSLAGLGPTDRAVMTVVLGAVKVVSTGLTVAFVDEWGRRPLFLAGLALMALSAATLVGATACLESGIGACGAASTGASQALVFAGCLGYTVAYQLSFGPLVFILGSEMFPPGIRGRLLGAQTLWGSACLAATSELFPALAQPASLGLSGTFACHLALTLGALAFVGTCLEETKGRSPEQNRAALERHLCSCGLGGAGGESEAAGRATRRCWGEVCCAMPPDDDDACDVDEDDEEEEEEEEEEKEEEKDLVDEPAFVCDSNGNGSGAGHSCGPTSAAAPVGHSRRASYSAELV